jgi:VCBS repeat-containing protein
VARASDRARAADINYGPLKRVGVKSSSGVIDDRKARPTLTVTVTVKQRTEVRLAIVDGDRLTSFAKKTLRPGRHRFTGRLRGGRPIGRRLQLRVTARNLVTRRRGRERFRVRFERAMNAAPTAIALTSATVAENQPAGTTVGALSGTDPNLLDTLTISLVAGAGATDNDAFVVDGPLLKTRAPLDFEERAARSIRLRVTDDAGATFERVTAIGVTDANDAPTGLALSSASIVENSAAGTAIGTLTAADQDAGATQAFALVAGTGDADNGRFEITGSTLAALAPLDYEEQATRSVRVQVADGKGGTLETPFTITVLPVNDIPVVAVTAADLVLVENAAGAVDPGLTVADPDDTQLNGAVVRVATGYVSGADELSFGDQNGITGAFDTATGVLTLSGAAGVAEYQAALRSIAYENRSDDPAAGRTVEFVLDDGDATSTPRTRTVTVTAVNDAPALTASAGPILYAESQPATPVDPGLFVADPDSPILTGATVQITGNHAAPEDVLALPAQPNITASYDNATGTLTLSGTDTLAAYRTALRAVTYRNTSSNPSTAQRTVTFTVSDASAASAPATRAVNVTATDNAPDVDNSPGALAYTENDPATAIDTAITITDVDSANLTGATAQITGNHAAPEDVLALPAQPGVTASYSSVTGTLTLSGTATVAEYEAALEAVTYRNTSDNPSTAARTVTYTARDAGGFGASDTHAIMIAAVDDAPTAADDSATLAEDAGATAVTVLADDTDVDGGPKSVASVTQPANGTAVNNGSDVSYTPNANYCNSPPGTSPDTFTYTLNGGSTATVSMTVTCSDDPPVAVNDAATLAEDAGATAVTVLADDTDVDGGPKSVASVTQPANGTAVNNGSDVSYTPNANYCNSPPGTSPDTFTYTLNGGSTATVSMTVTCSDDPPVAVDDSATVAEDSGTNPVDVRANDTDVDGGPIAVSSVTQPANGTVTNNGTDVSYTPDANYCNSPPGTSPDSFTYSLNGGSSATVAVTVVCSADAPVVSTSGTLSYTENAAATPIAPAITVTDADTVITGATVELTGNYAGAQDVLALGGSHPSITAQLTGDTLTLSGTATVAEYQAALRDVTYRNTSDSPSTLLRTATFTVTDDTALTGTDTRDIQVTAVDDNPAAVNDSTTVGEDSGVTLVFVLSNDTDSDGGPIAVSSVTQPANGTVTNNGTDVSYTPDANYCNNPPGTSPDTFTYTLSPGGSTATVSVTVTCAADAPDVTTSGGQVAYTESDPATPVDSGVTVTDADTGATITGATVAITSNFAGAQDVLALAGLHPLISAGPQVGNTLTLTGTASPAAYQAALRDVTYRNTSEGPSTLLRTVTFTVTDDTALSDSATRGISVAAVNDPPTAVDDSGTTDEDTTLNVAAPGVLANDTDVDPGDTKTVVALNGTGTLTQTLPSGASVTVNANGSYSYNPQSAFQGLSTGQTASDSFTYTMQDGASAQDTATVNITINGISDAPTAVADSYDAIGNTGLFVGTTRPAAQAGKEITGSVLSNDTDPDSPQANLVAEPVTNAPTTLGGTITIESDGNFTYHPDDADVGVTDTFTYRVCDASPCNSGTVANATGTLSLPLTGQVWYVRNNEPAGGDGTSDTPFDTLAAAEAASGTGDTVFVFDGNNTTTNLDTGYAMNSGERLIGQSQPLSLDPDGGGPLGTSPLHPGTAGAQPTLTASNEDVVALASNVLVDGLDLDPSGTGGGFSGGAGTAAVTVQNANVTDTGTLGTQPGIELDGTTGVNRFTGVTVTNGGSATAIGVRINNADRVLFANTATNTIATSGAKALDVASTSLLTSRWNDITVTGSGTGAIRLNSTTGQPVLGDGSGTDLSLQTTSGATAALDIASSNTVTVDAGGTDTISATGGPAADIRNSNGSQFFFDSASSTNSAGDGINLDTNLTAPFVANAGTIAGAAGIAVDVNGGGVGGGGVVYAGAINDGPGQSVEVTGRDGGGVTLSGNIADSGDAGGGIVVSGNSSGSTTFSGASKVLITGASGAVALSSNGSPVTGHVVTFSGGGLGIDTTSGHGLTSSGFGRLTVGGTGNTITTGTGVALNVDTTRITPGGLNFDSISANGSTQGIRLNSTGTEGALNVTGTGGACATTADPCSGGTIQNTTGDAVSLTSAQAITLQRMKIRNSLGNGVRGSSVTNFALRDSVVDNNGDDAATDEAGLHFTDLAGTSEFTRTLVANSPEDNARVVNASGTLSQLNVTDSTFRDTDTVSPGNNGLLLQADGGSITADVLGNTFLRNRANGLQVITNGTGSMDVEVDDSGAAQSTFDDNNIGVSIAHNSSGTFSYAVRDLTIDGLNVSPGTGGSASPININLASAATTPMVGRVTGNTVTNSNSTTGPGIRVTGNGSSTLTTLLDSNTVSQVANRGIEVIARDGSNRINATISNNSVTLDNALSADAIRVDAGSVSTDTSTICADIRGNTSSTTAAGLFGIRARQRFAGTTFILEDYAGAPTDDPAVQAFLSATNNGATTAADHGGAGFTSVADCPNAP